jgi:CheY-like chemotaxis protein
MLRRSTAVENSHALKGYPKVLRVMVVDDHLDAAEAIAMLAHTFGHDPTFAMNGEQAIQTATRFLPDVVFLDLVLPDIDGHQLARHIRAIPGLHSVHMYVVSAYATEEDRRKSREAGLAAHFVKPLDPNLSPISLTRLFRACRSNVAGGT